MDRYRRPDRRERRRGDPSGRLASRVSSGKPVRPRGSASIERGAIVQLVHDDEAESPFDLIREIATIAGWMAATAALLLLAWAALD